MSAPARRKILFYTHALTGGGAERVLALLASGFAERGCDVIFAVDYESDANRPFLSPAVRLVTLGANHATSLSNLVKLLRQHRPDITLSALAGQNLKHTLAARIAGRSKHAILSYHGFFQSEPMLLSRISYLLTPVLTRLTARTICVSDALLNHVTSVWRGSAKRSQRIYNPIAAQGMGATAADIMQRAPMVLACGRLVPAKNYIGLIRAFDMMQNKNAHLAIVGEGPEHAALMAEVARLGLQDRVSMPGYVSNAAQWFARASCVAISSDRETFSLVAVEALANGLPVITTNCDGPPEILDQGTYGTIVPFDDAPAMAKALDTALTNPGDSAPRIARAALFSMENALRAYDDLFEDVMENSARRA